MTAKDTMKNLIEILKEDKFENGSNVVHAYYKIN